MRHEVLASSTSIRARARQVLLEHVDVAVHAGDFVLQGFALELEVLALAHELLALAITLLALAQQGLPGVLGLLENLVPAHAGALSVAGEHGVVAVGLVQPAPQRQARFAVTAFDAVLVERPER
ncbi:MAG: hypothetical protein IPF57_23515 [Gammaproteobacteria bacterium]|nr:hypothetical protein [Gammaproteobacteria bacterium]